MKINDLFFTKKRIVPDFTMKDVGAPRAGEPDLRLDRARHDQFLTDTLGVKVIPDRTLSRRSCIFFERKDF